jgi:hypothetical protein
MSLRLLLVLHLGIHQHQLQLPADNSYMLLTISPAGKYGKYCFLLQPSVFTIHDHPLQFFCAWSRRMRAALDIRDPSRFASVEEMYGGEWKSSRFYWTRTLLTEGQFVVLFDEKVICPLFFEEPTVIGNTSMVMMENNVLRHERWEMHIKFWSKNLKRRNHVERLDVDLRIILKWILEKQGCEFVDCIHPAQVRDQWRALVNTVLNLRVAQ